MYPKNHNQSCAKGLLLFLLVLFLLVQTPLKALELKKPVLPTGERSDNSTIKRSVQGRIRINSDMDGNSEGEPEEDYEDASEDEPYFAEFAITCKDVATNATLGKFMVKGEEYSMVETNEILQQILAGDTNGRLKGYKLSQGNPPSYQAIDGKNYPMFFVKDSEGKTGDEHQVGEGAEVKQTVELREEGSHALLGSAYIVGKSGEVIEVKELLTRYPEFNLPGYVLSENAMSSFALQAGSDPYVLEYKKSNKEQPSSPPPAPKKVTITSNFQCKDEANGKVLTTIPIYGEPSEYVPTSVLLTLTSKFKIPGYELSPSNQNGYYLQNKAEFALYYRAVKGQSSESQKDPDNSKNEDKKTQNPTEPGGKEEADQEKGETSGKKSGDGGLKQPDWYFDNQGEEDRHPLLGSWELNRPQPCESKREAWIVSIREDKNLSLLKQRRSAQNTSFQ